MPRSGVYLGFDYGGRRLGVASGESITASATALTTLDCRDGEPEWPVVLELIGQWKPSGLVVGIPYHADGSPSESTRGAGRFARQLGERAGLPVHRIDERLSSHEAADRLRDAGRAVRSRGDRKRLDAVAAQIILETWLRDG